MKTQILSVVKAAMNIARDRYDEASVLRIVLLGLNEPFKTQHQCGRWSDAECHLHCEASHLGRAIADFVRAPDPVPVIKELFRDTVGTTDPVMLMDMVNQLRCKASDAIHSHPVYSVDGQFKFEVHYGTGKGYALKVRAYLNNCDQPEWVVTTESGADWSGNTAETILMTKAYVAQTK